MGGYWHAHLHEQHEGRRISAFALRSQHAGDIASHDHDHNAAVAEWGWHSNEIYAPYIRNITRLAISFTQATLDLLALQPERRGQ